jgi:hypothetical protein
MRDDFRTHITLLALLASAAAVFFAGIGWGLPSRSADRYLFGTSQQPWTAAEISSRTETSPDARLGADVDRNPVSIRGEPVILNTTDTHSAEIVRRYRLFSQQPDEMITFMALAGMQPRKLRLDPRLYQYGGLWIYPVGALVKLTINPRSNLSHYLDNPEQFGRFYLVARAYSATWGLIGVWAVFWLGRRCGGGSLVAASAAAGCYIVMPVVINMAHEAKPHLAGAVITLLAVVAATKFVETRATRWWIATAALCGAAAGMVLSAAVAIFIVPTMLILADLPWRRRATIAGSAATIALAVYFFANPYVAIHLLGDRTILRSNLSNSAAMYEMGRLGEGLANSFLLLREAASLPLLIAGTVSLVLLWLRVGVRKSLLLGVPCAVALAQFVLLAAGKPGEYGRFALLPAIALAIAAGTAIGVLVSRDANRIPIAIIVVALTAAPSWFYLVGFVRDSGPVSTRLEDAAWIERLRDAGGSTLAVFAEPAPYSLPPVDLFGWKIILVPRDWTIEQAAGVADLVIRPVDKQLPNGERVGALERASLTGPADRFPTRISWAGKPFEIWVRRDLLTRAAASN